MTVAVEFEIRIRKSIWHPRVTEMNLGAASDEDRKETHSQRDRAVPREASADVILTPPSLDALLISNKKEPDKSGLIFCSKIKCNEKKIKQTGTRIILPVGTLETAQYIVPIGVLPALRLLESCFQTDTGCG